MTDLIEQPLYVEDIEYEGQEFHLVGRQRLAANYCWKTVVPPDGRYNWAHFRTRIELSRSEPDTETVVGDREATITGPFECTDLSSESQLSIEVDGVDTNPEHSRPSEMLPDWITEEGDTGYATIELTYDEALTMDEKSWSPEKIEELRERYREMGY